MGQARWTNALWRSRLGTVPVLCACSALMTTARSSSRRVESRLECYHRGTLTYILSVAAKLFLLCCKGATTDLLFRRMHFPAADMSISNFRRQRQWSDLGALKSLSRWPRLFHDSSGATRGQHSQEERDRLYQKTNFAPALGASPATLIN